MMRRRDFTYGMLALGGISALPRMAQSQTSAGDDDDYMTVFDELDDFWLADHQQSEKIDSLRGDKRTQIKTIEATVMAASGGQGRPALVTSVRDQEQIYLTLKDEEKRAHWPKKYSDCADYRHLQPLGNVEGRHFTLNASLLKLVAVANGFQIDAADEIVIFGLRGCVIADNQPYRSWAAAQDLQECPPSHEKTQCVIGLWRLRDGMVSVYRGSTVPPGKHVYSAAMAQCGIGIGLLPTGLYTYVNGTHLKKHELRRHQPGAFLMATPNYFVMRLTGGPMAPSPGKSEAGWGVSETAYLPSSIETVWTEGGGYDIHSAASHDPFGFDCMGCQVISGYYENRDSDDDQKRSVGAWKQFQIDAGTYDPISGRYATPGAIKRKYMLLTGYDFALADSLGKARADVFKADTWLRPGSSGKGVQGLRSHFPGLGEGTYDYALTDHVLNLQKEMRGDYLSHIWDKSLKD